MTTTDRAIQQPPLNAGCVPNIVWGTREKFYIGGDYVKHKIFKAPNVKNSKFTITIGGISKFVGAFSLPSSIPAAASHGVIRTYMSFDPQRIYIVLRRENYLRH